MPEPARAEDTRLDRPYSRNNMRRCSTCGVQYPPDFLVCPKDATALDRVEGVDDDPMLGEVLAEHGRDQAGEVATQHSTAGHGGDERQRGAVGTG